jgi:hypothetical protein
LQFPEGDFSLLAIHRLHHVPQRRVRNGTLEAEAIDALRDNERRVGCETGWRRINYRDLIVARASPVTIGTLPPSKLIRIMAIGSRPS